MIDSTKLELFVSNHSSWFDCGQMGNGITFFGNCYLINEPANVYTFIYVLFFVIISTGFSLAYRRFFLKNTSLTIDIVLLLILFIVFIFTYLFYYFFLKIYF